MPVFHNIAAYHFATLTDLKPLRARLISLCKGWSLKGSILISPEGVNLFVAGAEDRIALLLAELQSIPGLEKLKAKISLSDHQPFNRMLVRIKKEIIAFGVPGIDPANRTSPKLSPATLKQWLDEGRPLTLLDTRNDYEVKLGTFKNALPIGIDHFRNFPRAVAQLPAEMKEQPIVMFCTGGIRCEKAGPFMEREGFKNIFQLEGGILKYFEDCGGAHYDGECFVFDQRVGVDPALHETESTQCFACQSPLTEAEQKDPRYVSGKSCPYCAKSAAEAMAALIKIRHAEIHSAITPLPGSGAYDNFRPMSVPQNCNGMKVLDFLGIILPHVERKEWMRLMEKELLVDSAHSPIRHDTQVVHTGERVYLKQPDIVEPTVNGNITILHEDEALIAINKPAPLPIHPGGRFNRNTLEYILHHVYYPQKPRTAHRLDANTTGILLLTRTRLFASRLQPQFMRGEVRKTYLAKVRGNPAWEEFTCDAPISATPGEIGSRTVDEECGLEARTEFKVIRRYEDNTALLEVRPITGRTNQIRVHLWKMGLSICGDSAYLPGEKLGETQTHSPQDPPLCLHSWKISFKHPLDGKHSEMTAPVPDWAG
jgi:RluA family pseudouridine synthase